MNVTIAIIADIHGTLAALEAVLDVLAHERSDQIVCLGDVAATGPQPREVLDRLRALGCPVVMGNADAELLDPHAAKSDADEDTRKILDIDRWCAAQLDEVDKAFVASFQPTIEIPLGTDRTLLCCHGSPKSYDNIIAATTPDEELDGMIGGHKAEMYASGHSHRRLLRAYRGREIVNPGSVGLAYQLSPDGTVRVPPWAEVAILSYAGDRTASVDFRRLPYDREASVRAMNDRDMLHAAWWTEDWR